MQDYYGMLAISRRAPEEVVKAAYKALCFTHKDEPNRLRVLNEAYEVLGDENKRKSYDKKLNNVGKGTIIGDYKLIKEIAEGGFGITYLAEHTRLGTQVCIKHALNISAEDEYLLTQEAKAIWDLRHFSIPCIRDIINLDDGSFALVMSYVPGPTLAQIVDKYKKIDAEHVAWIAERTLNALKYLHYHGVIHGDVKPQNIIVQNESHTIVLVDYGLSLIRPKKGAINKGYTPMFAAPEQIVGGALLPETDFYGLGMSMIYALGGDVTSYKLPSSVPDNLFNFVKKLIVKDIVHRPNWVKEDLTESIKAVRQKDFGRVSSNFKPLDY